MSSQRSIESRLASASLASFASFIVTLLQSLLMVPLLLAVWKPEVYGQWIVVTTAFGLLTTMDLGLQNYVGNLFTMAGGDREFIRDRLGSGVRAACITATGLAAVMAGIWFTRRIPAVAAIDSSENAALLMSLGMLVVYWAILGSIGGIAIRLYPAFGLLSRSLWLSLLQRLAMTVALVASAWLGAGLVGATIAWTAAGAVVTAVIFFDIRRRFAEYSPWWQAGSWREAIHLIGGSVGMIATAMLDSLALTVLVTLTDRWASAAGVALFAAVRTAANAIMQGSAVILTPVGPDLSRFASSRDSVRSSALLAISWLIATGPIALAVTAALPLTETVFCQWTRRALPFSPGMFVSLIVAVLVRQWMSPLAMLLFCTNSMRSQFLVSLGRCIASIAVGAGLFGVLGVPAMGIAVFGGEAVAAIGVAAMTPLVFPGLCDNRCRAAGALALVQVAVASAAMVAWWWLPAAAWLVWTTSLVVQLLLMAAQWRNLHPTARDRVVALFPPVLRRVMPISPIAMAVPLPAGPHTHPSMQRSES
jgi:hypothetical protein